MPSTEDLTSPSPLSASKRALWPQVVLVLALAALAQVAGLVFAYAERCKPGQGNDFCGAGSLAGVILGFVAAVVVLVAGLLVIFLRRKRAVGVSGVRAGRILAAVFGAILLVPSAWMIGAGWPRNNSNFALWLALLLGLALIAAAFAPRRTA